MCHLGSAENLKYDSVCNTSQQQQQEQQQQQQQEQLLNL